MTQLTGGDVHAIPFGDDENLAFLLHVLQNRLHRPGRTATRHGVVRAVDKGHIKTGAITVAALPLKRIGVPSPQSVLLSFCTCQTGDSNRSALICRAFHRVGKPIRHVN